MNTSDSSRYVALSDSHQLHHHHLVSSGRLINAWKLDYRKLRLPCSLLIHSSGHFFVSSSLVYNSYSYRAEQLLKLTFNPTFMSSSCSRFNLASALSFAYRSSLAVGKFLIWLLSSFSYWRSLSPGDTWKSVVDGIRYDEETS